ncbi:carotenoid oxygenase family protein [Nostoc commune]|uniref:carotenoid oxygenase family protein n=1 Tax=Nostoc commune TaxID=1178 RepID=UPI0018C5F4FD|nr:carotenoid oxygenase family protein [Nostoc commune]MBG1264673.1 dioxygenase [Nostoc commune BAE]
MKRREIIQLLGLGAVSTFGSVLVRPTSVLAKSESLPLLSAVFPTIRYQRLPILALATSLTQEYSYEARVEGRIPKQLQGTLYRNGPGLYDRGGLRKRNLLDGDGMIQAFRIQNGKVHYRNRFVQTKKYSEEAAAGKFLYNTWGTLVPKEAGLKPLSDYPADQAGVTVFARNGKVYAFDDGTGPAWELDPDTLRTIGVSGLGLPENSSPTFKAHSKFDAKTGEWILFSNPSSGEYYNIVTLNPDGKLKQQPQTVKIPRGNYMHDFFVTENYVIFNLHPVEIDVQKIALGESSIIDAFSWRPQQGNILLVVDRSGSTKPIQLTTEAAWMWHVLNAYEAGGEIIADFVGYDNPDHFIGTDPVLASLMSGRVSEQRFPGKIRRYVIDLRRKTVRQEIVDSGNNEFPFVNQHLSCYQNRFGYFTNGAIGSSVIKRVDMQTGKSQTYNFGENNYCLEPVFAPLPGFDYSANLTKEPGWLLTEVLNGYTKESFLAIFAADHVSDGPIAMVRLMHHVPYNFHGCWYSDL